MTLGSCDSSGDTTFKRNIESQIQECGENTNPFIHIRQIHGIGPIKNFTSRLSRVIRGDDLIAKTEEVQAEIYRNLTTLTQMGYKSVITEGITQSVIEKLSPTEIYRRVAYTELSGFQDLVNSIEQMAIYEHDRDYNELVRRNAHKRNIVEIDYRYCLSVHEKEDGEDISIGDFIECTSNISNRTENPVYLESLSRVEGFDDPNMPTLDLFYRWIQMSNEEELAKYNVVKHLYDRRRERIEEETDSILDSNPYFAGASLKLASEGKIELVEGEDEKLNDNAFRAIRNLQNLEGDIRGRLVGNIDDLETLNSCILSTTRDFNVLEAQRCGIDEEIVLELQSLNDKFREAQLERDRFVVDTMHKSNSNVVVFGGNHDFSIPVSEWNYENSDEKPFCLITVTPDSYPDLSR